MKRRVWLAGLAVVFAAAFGFGAFANADDGGDSDSVWRARDGRALIFSHRGGAGIFPENTIAAMRGSAKLGVDALDMDARLSSDGVLMAFHDETLERTTNGSGALSAHSAAELESLNAAANFTKPDGEKHEPVPVPRIADILREFSESDLLFIIELKDREQKGEQAARQLAGIVGELNLQKRVIIGSFGGAAVAAFRKALPEAATSASQSEAAGFVMLGKIGLEGAYSPPIRALQLPPFAFGINLANKATIEKAHANGYAVHYWTINNAQEMTALTAIGADAIFTDYPDILREVIKNKNGEESLPKPFPGGEKTF